MSTWSAEKIDEYYPYKKFRLYQQNSFINEIEAFDDGLTVFDCTPTGGGKSGKNITLCRMAEGGSIYTSPFKHLIDQICDDKHLKSFHKPVLGRCRYPCVAPDGVGLMCDDERIPCNQIDEVDRAEFYKNSDTCCTATVAMEGTVPPKGCKYYLAVQKANQSPIASMTLNYLLAIRNNCVYAPFIEREVLVIDEAHKVPDVVRKSCTEQITETLFFWNDIVSTIPDSNKYDGPNKYWRACWLWLVEEVEPIARKKLEEKNLELNEIFPAFHRVETEINRAIMRHDKELERKKRREKYELLKRIKDNKRYKAIISDRNRCKGVIAKVERIISVKTDFVVVREYKEVRGKQYLKSVAFIPLFIHEFLHRITDPFSHVVFSSATISKYLIEREFNYKVGDDCMVTKPPHPFSEETRRVYAIPYGNMKYEKNTKGKNRKTVELPKICKGITKIIDNAVKWHGHPLNSLVHCNSYELQDIVYEKLEKRYGKDVIYYPRAEGNDVERETILKKFKYGTGKVLLTVRCEDGLDLPYDTCRLNFITSIPYPNTDDPYVKTRIHPPYEHWEWLFNEVAIKIVQASGRTTRHSDDWSKTYILDERFSEEYYKKHRRLYPTWFKPIFLKKR